MQRTAKKLTVNGADINTDIPSCLFNADALLEELSLNSNALTGNVPSEIVDLSMLRSFDVGGVRCVAQEI